MRPTAPAQPWIKSDEIQLDTSQAPWMDFAKAELGKKIHEMKADDAFIDSMRRALTLDEGMRAVERKIETFGKDSNLLGKPTSPSDADYSPGFSKTLDNPARTLLGRMVRTRSATGTPRSTSISTTGSTTGHVAFFLESRGHNVILLGGNQGDAVSAAPLAKVLGYRWPTRINHYLFAGSGVLT